MRGGRDPLQYLGGDSRCRPRGRQLVPSRLVTSTSDGRDKRGSYTPFRGLQGGLDRTPTPSPDHEPPAAACSDLEVPRQAPQPGSSRISSGRPMSSGPLESRLPSALRGTWTMSKEAQLESRLYMLAAGPALSTFGLRVEGSRCPLLDDKAGLSRKRQSQGYKSARFHARNSWVILVGRLTGASAEGLRRGCGGSLESRLFRAVRGFR